MGSKVKIVFNLEKHEHKLIQQVARVGGVSPAAYIKNALKLVLLGDLQALKQEYEKHEIKL